ncbi:SIR2 family protein [Mesorhizobium sp. AR02]|uniref:SIR2 family protein n=1 Tax=Mesorhizobium sp. AR02 TaxID=2865837 RepID=UPI00216028B4|nr:SIR2 family protein [Mesorhizobium sp. AR02]
MQRYKGGRLPAAWEISVAETIALLEADFPGMAGAVARGRYALWLGSGISLDRVVGVPAVIGRVIEYLRSRMDAGNPTCRYKVALDQVLANLSPPERERLHLDLPIDDWPEADRRAVTSRLAGFYAEVLETPLEGEPDPDFLLWTAVDVPGSFTGDDPDVEHLCVVMLTLEGAFRDITSANWDYLIEAAENKLIGAVGTKIDVCIRAPDFQNASGRAKLLKYHGCAVRAVANSAVYRPLLIARTPQITQYGVNAAYAVMRDHLTALVQQRRTLMIGFSAQDTDVQHIFVHGANGSGWEWNAAPTAFLFAEDALSGGQRGILASAYGEQYAPHRPAIEESARIRAFAKPLLLALLLTVLELKAAALADLGLPAAWNAAERNTVKIGLRHIRDAAAMAADPERLKFTHSLIATMMLGLDLFHHGKSDSGRYIPLSSDPIQQIADVPETTGLRQAAIAFALLGKGAADGDWSISAGTAMTTPINLQQGSRVTRVFVAANDDVAGKMIQAGHVDPDADDTVLLLSTSPKARRARSSSGPMGRTGKIGLREVCLTSMIDTATDALDLIGAFKRSTSL